MSAPTHAAFATVDDARAALARLAGGGVAASDVEVRSSIPHHGLEPEGADVRSRVPKMAMIGGLLGGTGAYLLMSLSSQAYPLPTGGMPIVALPPAGVITFEGTAIGAILFTVATVMLEGGLPRFRAVSGPLDAYVAAGQIVITVRDGVAPPAGWAEGAVETAETAATGEDS